MILSESRTLAYLQEPQVSVIFLEPLFNEFYAVLLSRHQGCDGDFGQSLRGQFFVVFLPDILLADLPLEIGKQNIWLTIIF